jgi:hypothetical protein
MLLMNTIALSGLRLATQHLTEMPLSGGLSKMSDYEDALRRARAEGWRDPVAVSILEIKAYEAGMRVERNRVLSIFKGIEKDQPMRAYDIWKYINKIKNKEV